MKKAFTLIELLVVISIIGLLSSIVLVSFQGSKEKARIAKILEFSQSLYHVLGVNAVGIWGLDESPASNGTTIIDSSGNGKNGTLITNDGLTNKSVPGIIGQALSFDGVGDYINLGNPTTLKPATFTITLWVYPKESKWMYYLSKGYYAANHIALGYHTTYPGWWIAYNLSSNNWGTFVMNRWAFLTIVYDGTSFILYENGAWKKNVVVAFDLTSNTQEWWIGVENGPQSSSRYWNGLIDEVYIYSQALSTAQIQKLYVEGLEKHQDLAIK